MKKEKFIIKNKSGLSIRGQLINFSSEQPLILLIHGFGGWMGEPQFRHYRKFFARQGYSVCAFDFTNSLGKSDRNLKLLSYEQMKDDLLKVLAFLKNVGVGEIFAIGHSIGGALLIDLLTESDRADQIAKIALINPLIKRRSPIQEYIGKRIRVKIVDSEPHIRVKKFLSSISVPLTLFNKLSDVDMTPLAKKIKIPVLFILGERDQTTPPEYALSFSKAVTAQHQVISFATLGHAFFHKSARRLLPEISAEIDKWFRNKK